MDKQIVIQDRIEQVMNEEFSKLLRENTEDKLLKILIEDKLDNFSLEDLIKILSED